MRPVSFLFLMMRIRPVVGQASCLSARRTSKGSRNRLEACSTRRNGDLADLSGAYACSLPELDRIVDTARRQPGVEGAQLAGAGLGGCIMVLVQKPHTGGLLKTLTEQGIQADVFRPIAGACSLVMG